MEFRPITYSIEEDGAVIKIVIDNPELKNGLDWIAMEILCEAYEKAINDRNIKCVLICGNGKYWHTGGRVNAKDPEEQKKYSDNLKRMQELQDQLTVPIIAAVNGDCLKGGMGLLAEADLAVAREDVQFGFPELRMGGVPMVVMADTISMPKKRSLEAYYSSNYFSAEEALKMGLVNRVVSEEDFWPTVNEFVHMVIDKPRDLIEMTREAYYTMIEMPSRAERTAWALETLRNRVLKAMEKGKTEHNV